MNNLVQDIRFGLRGLARNPAFALAAILALALGIGANTAIFSVVNIVLLRPLSYPNPDRLIWIWAQDPGRNIPFHYFLYSDFAEWKREQHSFEAAAAYSSVAMNLSKAGTGVETPERVNVWRVNADFFRTLGLQPVVGRDFVEDDDKPGAGHVAILTDALWRRRFNSDQSVIGQSVRLDGTGYTIIAVLPHSLQMGGREADLFVPIALSPSTSGPNANFTIAGFARLRTGVTMSQARAETNAICSHLNPAFFRSGGRSLRLWQAHEFLVRDVRVSLLVLLAAVGLVLLIACANVANLLLARAGARQREIAMRATLGAGRSRILRQLLTESALLGAMGGAVGLVLAHWGVKLVVLLSPEKYPLLHSTRIDSPVLAFTMIVSLLTGLVFGLAPALSLSRTELQEALKEGGRSSTEGVGRHRLRSALVTSEVALALVLAIGSGLVVKAFVCLQQVQPGFNPHGVLTANINLPPQIYPDPQQRIAFYHQLLANIRRQPGVRAAGMANQLPLGGINSGTNVHLEGEPEPRPEDAPVVWFRSASADYFRAMEIPLRKGRLFNEQDTADAPSVVIVNETMAKRFWPRQNPIGKRLAFGLTGRTTANRPPPPWMTVVGVVGDIRHMSLAQEPDSELFMPYTQAAFPGMGLVIRTTANPLYFTPSLRSAVLALDKELPVSRVADMEQTVYESIANRRITTLLLAIFAGIALALASVGIYGVIAFSVTQRTHEIGVRLALGAEPRDVLRLILAQEMKAVLIGLAIGLVAAFSLTRWMSSLLYGITARDPLIFLGVTALLAGVAFLASYIPALRATKVDPMAALRYE